MTRWEILQIATEIYAHYNKGTDFWELVSEVEIYLSDKESEIVDEDE